MPDVIAKRTLVKSPPELWSELSEVDRLAKHLDAFGEIQITKLEPEHTVAWEGEGASGTVSIEPSGWGTKVTLTAQLPADLEAEAAEPVVEEPEAAEPVVEEPEAADPVEAEPVAADPSPPEGPEQVQTPPRRKRGFLAWLFRPRTAGQEDGDEAATEAESPAVEEPEGAVPVSEPVVEPAEPEGVAEPEPEPAPEPVPVEPAAPAEREPDAVADTVAVANTGADDAHTGLGPHNAQSVLDEVLDSLGSAHHRPFSRG